ncbi:unnamed protein product, partial [Hapterophycus canaliculatus]
MRCGGTGHSVGKCPSEAAVLAFDILSPEEEAAVDAEAYVARERSPGKCSDSACSEGGKGSARQTKEEPFILDSGTSSTMVASDDCFSNYHECDKRVRVAGRRVLPIAGQGDVIISLRSGQGRIPLKLRDVFHVPQLGHDLISFRDVLAAGHDVET